MQLLFGQLKPPAPFRFPDRDPHKARPASIEPSESMSDANVINLSLGPQVIDRLLTCYLLICCIKSVTGVRLRRDFGRYRCKPMSHYKQELPTKILSKYRQIDVKTTSNWRCMIIPTIKAY
jgi:hypothetical protein